MSVIDAVRDIFFPEELVSTGLMERCVYISPKFVMITGSFDQ